MDFAPLENVRTNCKLFQMVLNQVNWIKEFFGVLHAFRPQEIWI